MNFIYHVVLPVEWGKFEGLDFYVHASLGSEGFIHCSYAGQVAGVLERYYKGVEEVLILKIDVALLTSRVEVEIAANGELYPHVYGEIIRGAVVEVEKKVAGENTSDGIF